MEQSTLAKWLKTIIIGIGICGILIYALIFPYLGNNIINSNSQYASWYWPWLVFLWITAIPCFSVLFYGWKISDEIGKDNSFSSENASSLKSISLLSAIDSFVLFAGNVIFMALKMNNMIIIGMSLIIIFVGISISVATAALSHLVFKAMKIEEENELTI